MLCCSGLSQGKEVEAEEVAKKKKSRSMFLVEMRTGHESSRFDQLELSFVICHQGGKNA